MGAMPDPIALGGQVALAVSALAVAVCAARVWPRARRVRRRARQFDARLRREQEVLLDGVVLLLGQGIEMNRLLDPWRRILFWARHPLTRALWAQYVSR